MSDYYDMYFFRKDYKLKINHSPTPDNLEHRLIWSPHVPSSDEDEEDQDICNIVLTHGNNVSFFVFFSIYERIMSA